MNTLHKMRIKFRNKVWPWAQRVVNGLSSQSVPKTTKLISKQLKHNLTSVECFHFIDCIHKSLPLQLNCFHIFLFFHRFLFDLVSLIYRTIVSKIQITLKCKLEQINCLFFG